MNWLKRTMEQIKNPKATAKLKSWQSKYENAKGKYDNDLHNMDINESYYEGTKLVYNSRDRRSDIAIASKEAINVRNICYELIESQVDTSVPMPKVTAIHPEDEEQAKKIEKFLENEIRTLGFKELNDLQERIVPIQGGDYFLVEWDMTKGYHCNIGDLAVQTLHPRNVIPQPGVTDIDKMDYIFTRTTQTKDYVKKPQAHMWLAKLKLSKFPNMLNTMKNRYKMYNGQKEYIRNQEEVGKAFVIRPEEPLNIGATEKNPEELQRVYELGRAAATRNMEALRAYFEM